MIPVTWGGALTLQELLDGGREWETVRTHDAGPQGMLPITPEMLLQRDNEAFKL